MVAGADGKRVDALCRYGEKLGTAFQIHDDVLNLTASFETYQKEIGGDIIEGKRTLMVVHALSSCSEKEKALLEGLLSKGPQGYPDEGSRAEAIEAARGILSSHGSLEYASLRADALVEEALSELEGLAGGEDKDSLKALARYVVRRDR